MQKKYLILILVTLFYINGIAQQWHFNIDILQAPKVVTELKNEDLLIVNNALEQPIDFGHNVKKDDVSQGSIDIDLSAARLNCLFAVTQTLEESRIFKSVSLLDVCQNKAGTFWHKNLLTQQQTDSLCEYYQVDAILSLEQLVIYDVVENFLTTDEDYYAYLQAFQTSVWSLQYADGRKHQDFTLVDTLIWEGRAYTRENAIQQLPDRKTALLDMSTYVGEKSALALLPLWETTDRYIYEDASEVMQKGLERFFHKDWEHSIQLLTEVYSSPSANSKQKETKKVLLLRQAYCAADIAVAYEMLDNYKEAKNWAEKSVKAFGKLKNAEALQQQININYYIQQLNQRICNSLKNS